MYLTSIQPQFDFKRKKPWPSESHGILRQCIGNWRLVPTLRLQNITIAARNPIFRHAASSTMVAVLPGSVLRCFPLVRLFPYIKTAMKYSSTFATFLLTALSVSSPVAAQHEASRGKDFARGQGSAEVQRSWMRRNEQKAIDGNTEQPLLREASTTQQTGELKPIPAQGLAPNQVRERLSPEERRQLRRDINAAGRDIYRRNKPD